MSKTGLEEKIAKIIYDFAQGCWPEEHELIFGQPKLEWLKLEEWERDDYRLQARQVIKYLVTGKVEGMPKDRQHEIQKDKQNKS